METLNQSIENGSVKMVKPIILFDRPTFITCYFREVKNPKHKHFGLWHGHTTSHYDPFWEVFQKDNLHIPIADCIEKAKELGFFIVKGSFNIINFEDLREIKTELSQEWIDKYNAANI